MPKKIKTVAQMLLHAEHETINTILPKFTGFHFLKVGKFLKGQALKSSVIPHHIFLSQDNILKNSKDDCVRGLYDEIPILSNSIDLVLLTHTFEEMVNPQVLLQELWRILIPEGRAIIIGCNPYSMLGLYKMLRRSTEFPWDRHFLSSHKLGRMLKKIGF